MSSKAEVFIGLGSNLDDPVGHLRWAARRLDAIVGTRVVALSPLYTSEPIGIKDQPEFTNAVAKIETSLSPPALLRALGELEEERGRDRSGPRWGPRILDLDILLYNDTEWVEEGLTIPHPEMAQRNFVLVPLCDLTGGDFRIAGLGVLRDLIAHCPRGHLKRIGTF